MASQNMTSRGQPLQQQHNADFKEEELIKIVDQMLVSGINFLAIDFDKTFVSIHTHGNWPGSSSALSRKARPIFKVLIPLAMSKGIAVAIVTFSSQVRLIQQVIHDLFPELSSYIPVRGRDLSWDYKGDGCKEGKQMHMASAAEELNSNSSITSGITRVSTLLIDDDINNVSSARFRAHVHSCVCASSYP
jgi:hypothetical protein